MNMFNMPVTANNQSGSYRVKPIVKKFIGGKKL